MPDLEKDTDAIVHSIKDELAVKLIAAGEQFFGRSPLDPTPDKNSLEERLRLLTYWVCCGVEAENADPTAGPNYRGNLDWVFAHIHHWIAMGSDYQRSHPEQKVHPLNLVTPDDKTAFHRAVEGAANETLQLLLVHQKTLTKPNLNVKAKGITPLGRLLRLGLDTPKRVACFWVLINHMLEHSAQDESCPIPLFAFQLMKDDPAKFASFQATVARKKAEANRAVFMAVNSRRVAD